MSLYQLVLEKEEEQSDKKQQMLELQALKSKMQSLREHLKALADKKVRLDLEIQRTKVKLSKLQKFSTTRLKSSLSLEILDVDPNSRSELVLEAYGQEFFDVTLALDQEIDEAVRLLDELESLPLFEDR